MSDHEHAHEERDRLSLTERAYYRIRVMGRLGGAWSDDLGGMSVSAHVDPSGRTVTSVAGEVADQAALVGVLNRLYGLGLPLVSVEWRPAGE